jgi:hypothetical protein
MVAFDDLASTDAVADQRRSDFHPDTLEGETNGRQDQCSNIDCRIFRDRLHHGWSIAMTSEERMALGILIGSQLVLIGLIIFIGLQP